MSSNAVDLWPSDLVPQEVVTPRQIMLMQAKALDSRMNGLLFAEVKSLTVEGEAESRISLRFEIYAATSLRRLKLFEAAHRVDFPYPVALSGPPDELPSFLREKHYAPSFSEVLSAITVKPVLSPQGRWVENEATICATPHEFTAKLKELLASVEIKSAVMSLLEPSQNVETKQGTCN